MAVVFWLLWLVFAFFASQFMVAGLLSLLPVGLSSENTLLLTVAQAAIYVIMLAIGVGVPYLFKHKIKLPKLRELLAVDRRPKLADLWGGAKYLLIYYGILFAVMVPLVLWLPDVMKEQQSLDFSTTGNAPWQLILIFVSLVIIAPLAEELMMRGLLFGRLRAKLSFWPTALLVSVVFAVAHWQINVSIDTFILSMVACYAREKTDTIYSSVLIHTIKNGLAFGLLFLT